MKEERIENLIDKIVKASLPNQDEINAVAESPFLYRRIRNRIEEERQDNSILRFWADLFRVFKLATQATAIIALVALGVLLFLPSNTTLPSDNSSAQRQSADLYDEEMFNETIGLSTEVKSPKEVKK